VENAVTNAVKIGANSFALFLKSPLKWTSPSLTPQSISKFKKRMEQYGYANDMVLPIGNYLIHFGDPKSDRKKSYECLLDDLRRCEALGLKLYNLRLSYTVGETPIESYRTLIADCINRAHKATRTVTIVMNSRDGSKRSIDFADFAEIIANVNDKTRVGVSLDIFSPIASGHDIKTKEGWNAAMHRFDRIIGLKYLRGMHLSDINSNSKKGQLIRQNIGLGYLGIAAFQHILNDSRTQNIPLILATRCFKQPKAIWGKEIEILQSLTTHSANRTDVLNPVATLKSVIEEAKSENEKRKSEKKTTGLT